METSPAPVLAPVPLSILEAPVVWAAFETELPGVAVGAVRGMGLRRAARGVAHGTRGGFGRGPGYRWVREALIADIGLYDRVYDAVRTHFTETVLRGRVWRANALGWLNVATRRTTQRLATARAAQLLAEVQPTSLGADPVDQLVDPAPFADEQLDTARLCAAAARLLGELTDLERDLLDLGELPRDYVAISAHTSLPIGTLRKRAFDLRARLRARLIEEVGDAEIAAE